MLAKFMSINPQNPPEASKIIGGKALASLTVNLV